MNEEMKRALRKVADLYGIEELESPTGFNVQFRAILDSKKHIYFNPLKVKENQYVVEVETQGGQITFFKDVPLVLCVFY